MVGRIDSLAETPVLTPQVTIDAYGPRQLRTALLWPSGHQPGSGPLPVLLDPYGGPGRPAGAGRLGTPSWSPSGSPTKASRCWSSMAGAVPGRGPAWERTIRGDFATPVLEDQVEALHEAAAVYPDLDLGRVAIRGWSFGGFVAALAVLRRPDVFHAAVAGAPVTEHLLYDTHYMERYLGHPAQELGKLRALLAHRRRPQPAAASAAHPRSRGRQRGRGPHLAAVRGVDGCRSPALRPAAERGHPYDAPGGSGREPAADRAGVPAAVAWNDLRNPSRRVDS